MIKINYNGHMGNNMFQYSFARIIAENKGYKFTVNSVRSNSLCFFKNAYESIDGKIIEPYTEMHFNHKVDLDLIKNCSTGIILNGFFQRYEYYKNYMDKIKNWFYIDAKEIYDKPSINDLVVHVRLSDYTDLKLNLPFDYVWENALKIKTDNKLENIVIVTNETTQEGFLKFKEKDCKFFHKSIIEDFSYLKNANHLMIAQSSYSWWAGILGNGNVYFPTIKMGHNHWSKDTDDCHDLYVDDPRYNYF
jgi:hypothetical protein